MGKADLTKKVDQCVRSVKTVVRANVTVKEALANLRQKQINERIIYFYVVDEKKHLLGVVSTRSLLLSDPQTKIDEAMDKGVILLKGSQTLQEALEVLQSHQLLALPVVDEEGKFLGTVDVDHYLEEAVDVANARRRNDIFQLMGMDVEEGKRPTPWGGFKSRMPWIFCNMFGGFACAIISRAYEMVLAQVLVLAMFIPLILTLSESISMQSMTQTIESLRHHTTHFKYYIQSLLREWKTIALLATTCGVIVGFVSLLWGEGHLTAWTIGSGITLSVFLSASIGASVPPILHARKWDPKVAAGPVVLMIADVLSTALYLTLATWVLL